MNGTSLTGVCGYLRPRCARCLCGGRAYGSEVPRRTSTAAEGYQCREGRYHPAIVVDNDYRCNVVHKLYSGAYSDVHGGTC